jgi:type I restriction enzyme S subunit
MNKVESKTFGEFLDILTDYTANGSFESLKQNVKYYTENNYAVLVRTTDLEKSVFKPARFTNKRGYDFLKKTSLYGGEIVLANVGSVGKVYKVPFYNKPMTLAPNTYLVRFNKEIDNEYIYQFLKSHFYIKELFKNIGSTTLQAINKDNFRSINFFFHSLPQQQKIAKILTTCDAVIEKTEAAIAKYQAMKQGLMHDLFTRGIDTNTGKLRLKYEDAKHLYKESELGWIPKEWEVRKLEELTNYVDYRGKTPPKTDKGIFLITAKNIKQGYIDYENSQEYIPEYAYKAAMSRGIPEIGDVLITTEAPMGNVAQINVEGFALAQRVIKYRCISTEMHNDFLKHSLMAEYFQKELEAESTGSTVKGIKGSRLHQLEIFKPELKEQENIIQSLAPLELKLQTEQSALSKYQKLKTGLMQDLLSGKVEVKV